MNSQTPNLKFALALAKTIIDLNIKKVSQYDDETLALFTDGEYACCQTLDINTGFLSGPNGQNWLNIYEN